MGDRQIAQQLMFIRRRSGFNKKAAVLPFMVMETIMQSEINQSCVEILYRSQLTKGTQSNQFLNLMVIKGGRKWNVVRLA